MKLYWDITKSVGYAHHSGIRRVALALGQALESILQNDFSWVVWNSRKKCFQKTHPFSEDLPSRVVPMDDPEAWLISPEVFREKERKGFSNWCQAFSGKWGLIFHDLIPIRFPEITWPKSVRRHPEYIQLLAKADRIFSVSQASLDDLFAYTRDRGLTLPPSVILKLASFRVPEKLPPKEDPPPLKILQVAILEPRKNQEILLDALELLWSEKQLIEATFVGRVNPHFGKPIAKRIKNLKKAGHPVKHLDAPDDANLVDCYQKSHLTVLPAKTEGAGLPLLESLSYGTPVLGSNIPSFQEYGENLPVRFFPSENLELLTQTLGQLVKEPHGWEKWYQQARSCNLHSWEDTARELINTLKNSDPG